MSPPGNGLPADPLTATQLRVDRRLYIVSAVVGVHVLGLWALQNGLLRRAVEQVVPVQVLSDWIEPPQPEIPPPAPPPPAPPPRPQPPQKAQPVQKTAPVRPPAPQPVAIADPTPAPQAATGVIEPQPAQPPAAAPAAVAEAPAAPPAPPAPPKVELPSSSADYLNNAPPPYPALSRRLGEQGKVVLRVYIEANGTASKAEVRSSSGFERLDQTALQTVLKWRYVPGKRAGVPEAMWFNVPLSFVLE